jgi:hypothetical protein
MRRLIFRFLFLPVSFQLIFFTYYCFSGASAWKGLPDSGLTGLAIAFSAINKIVIPKPATYL